jgi:LysR family transcriptional regulator, nitrogen assimilation regulatory protein
MKSIIAKGIACGVLPYSVVAEEIAAGLVSARPIGEPALSRTLFIVRDARGSPSDAIGTVINVIREVIRELCVENANYELV